MVDVERAPGAVLECWGIRLFWSPSDWDYNNFEPSPAKLALVIACRKKPTGMGRHWGYVLVSTGKIGWACVNEHEPL